MVKVFVEWGWLNTTTTLTDALGLTSVLNKVTMKWNSLILLGHKRNGAWKTVIYVICVSAVSLNYMPHHLPTYNLQIGCKFARKKIMEEKEIHWFDPMSMCYKVIITVNLLPKAKVRKRSTERKWMCGWILKSCTCGCWLAWEESGGEWKKNEPTCWSIDGT